MSVLFDKYNTPSSNIMLIINIMAIALFSVLIIWRFIKPSFKSALKTNNFFDRYNYIILALIFLVGALVRIYKLSIYPITCPPDETSAMYDALCIFKYGTNRWGQVNAVYFDTWGGAGQSPAMANLMALSMKIFGQSVFAMRLAQAIPATLTIIVMYLICVRLSDKFTGLIAAAVLAVSPYHIMLSRWGLDCNLSAFFTAVAFCFLLYSFDKNGKMNKLFYLFCIFGALSLYTYALTCISMFIFVVLIYISLLLKKKIDWRIFIPANVLFGILAFPMIYFVLVNKGFAPPVETSFITIPHLAHFRANEININFISNITDTIKYIFSPGVSLVNFLPEFRLFYGFSIVFLIVGLFVFFKSIKNDQNHIFVLFWLFGAMMPTAFVGGATRSVNLWVIMPVLIAFGIKWLYDGHASTLFVITPVYAVRFVLFIYAYFVNYSQAIGIQTCASQKDAIHFATTEINANEIYCSMYNGKPDAFIFCAIDNMDSPDEYQKKIVRTPDEESGYLITQYDRLHFFSDIQEEAVKNLDNDSVAFILYNYIDDVTYFTNLGYNLEIFQNYSVAYK